MREHENRSKGQTFFGDLRTIALLSQNVCPIMTQDREKDMSKYSLVKYMLHDLKHCARYPPAMRYENDQQIRKSKEDYSSELYRLKAAHPRVSADDIEKGYYTHTLMTGGKFLLNEEPIPAHVTFHDAFAALHLSFRDAAPRLLRRKETYHDMLWLIIKHTIVSKKLWDQDACLTEAVSKPYHRFFLDLDLLFAEEHESEATWNMFVRKVCLSVGKAVLSCYPDIATTRDPTGHLEFSILCTKGYRAKVLSDTVTVYKRGMHMVWPQLIVDKQGAECLARVIDEFLTKDVPRDLRGSENAWKDAIDLSVYSSGLRPVGCAKIKPCPKCRSIIKKKVPTGMSHDVSAQYIGYKLCHPPMGFVSQGDESIYSLDYISRADGVIFSKANFKVRLDSHVLKDDVTGKDFDFSLRNLTSIRTTNTETTAGFTPPSHLRTPFNMETTDYNVHVKQDPETGDYLPLAKRKKTNPRNSHPLILSISQIGALTSIVQNFHDNYRKVILDRVWAFPTEDPRKLLPPRKGEAPRRTLYNHIWVVVKGEGSQYCHNKPGFHGSSSVRFHIDYEGNIYQNCWCAKSYNGKPCNKQLTKGKPGFIDKIVPAHYNVFVDIFTTKNE